jgi:spore maturation protein SpmB
MNLAIDVLLHAGRSAVDVALYTLLPIMVLMMIVMRALEASGALDKIVALLTPVVRPFGLTGLGALAMIQISLVSFVAPITTLALMEDRGSSDRRLAAVFAAVLAMAPANALFPLATFGLHPGIALGLSAIGGLSPRPQPIGFWAGAYPAKQTRSANSKQRPLGGRRCSTSSMSAAGKLFRLS